MSLIESISRGAFGIRADISGAPAPGDDYWYGPVGGSSASGMRISPETVKRIGTVIACVSAKARQLAMLPCKIYTDVASGGKRVVSNHPLYDVLYIQPNDIQTAFEFKMMMQGHVELRGNAYAEKIAGPRGPVDQLIPMHPDRVKVEVLKGSGRLRYIYDDPLTGTKRALMQDEVFHLRDWADSSAVGQSRITMAVDVFGVALAQQDYISRFLKNDARAGIAITGANFKTNEQEKDFREKFQQSQTGANRGKTIMLPPGLDIKTISVTPNDAQLLDSWKASDVRICTIFNVLPHQVGVDAGKSATYASVEQFNIMNQQQSVLPMVIMWEQAIQRDLIISANYYAKFSMASLLRGDSATRAVFYNSAIQSGWMNPDEVRELEDLNPIPDGVGETYWRQSNWSPLKQTTNPQPVSPFGKSNLKDTDEDEDDDQSSENGAGSLGESDQQASLARMQLMASGAAARCVRREVSGVRRLIEHMAGNYEVTEFYAEQWLFIAEVFHMDPTTSMWAKTACDNRAGMLIRFLVNEEKDEAMQWIEHVAATEPVKLATLAVEGVK